MTRLFDMVYLESRSGSAVSATSSCTTNTEYTARITPPGQVLTPPPAEGDEDISHHHHHHHEESNHSPEEGEDEEATQEGEEAA